MQSSVSPASVRLRVPFCKLPLSVDVSFFFHSTPGYTGIPLCSHSTLGHRRSLRVRLVATYLLTPGVPWVHILSLGPLPSWAVLRSLGTPSSCSRISQTQIWRSAVSQGWDWGAWFRLPISGTVETGPHCPPPSLLPVPLTASLVPSTGDGFVLVFSASRKPGSYKTCFIQISCSARSLFCSCKAKPFATPKPGRTLSLPSHLPLKQ